MASVNEKTQVSGRSQLEYVMLLKAIICVCERLFSGFWWHIGLQGEAVTLERNWWALSANTKKWEQGECHRHLGNSRDGISLEKAKEDLGTKAKGSNPEDHRCHRVRLRVHSAREQKYLPLPNDMRIWSDAWQNKVVRAQRYHRWMADLTCIYVVFWTLLSFTPTPTIPLVL